MFKKKVLQKSNDNQSAQKSKTLHDLLYHELKQVKTLYAV